MKNFLKLFLVATLLFSFTNCTNKSSTEKTADDIEGAAEEAGDEIEDAADEVEDELDR